MPPQLTFLYVTGWLTTSTWTPGPQTVLVLPSTSTSSSLQQSPTQSSTSQGLGTGPDFFLSPTTIYKILVYFPNISNQFFPPQRCISSSQANPTPLSLLQNQRCTSRINVLSSQKILYCKMVVITTSRLQNKNLPTCKRDYNFSQSQWLTSLCAFSPISEKCFPLYCT